MSGILFVNGCSDSPGSGGLESFNLGSDTLHPSNLCCDTTFHFNFKQTNSCDHKYSIEVRDINDSTVYESEAVLQSCGYAPCWLHGLAFLLYHNIPYTGRYGFYVNEYDLNDALVGSAGPLYLNLVSYDAGSYISCFENCCSYQGRNYVEVVKTISDVIGIKANIESNYGNVCKEYSISGDTTRNEAYCAVYCGIADVTASMSAQMGFGYARNYFKWHTPETQRFWYWEVIGSGDNKEDYYEIIDYPNPGTTPEYRCELDTNLGIWYFYKGGLTTGMWYDSSWLGVTGEYAVWAGEIYHFEDDMAGSITDECSIFDCAYAISPTLYMYPTIGANDVINDNENEWGLRFMGSSSFEIWDKKRQ